MKKYLSLTNFVYLMCLVFASLIAYSSCNWLLTEFWYYEGCSFFGYYDVAYETPIERYGYYIIGFAPIRALFVMPVYLLAPGLIFWVLAVAHFKTRFLDY